MMPAGSPRVDLDGHSAFTPLVARIEEAVRTLRQGRGEAVRDLTGIREGLKATLLPHMEREESLLFPAAHKALADGGRVVFRLIRQHELIREALDRLGGALAGAGPEGGDAEGEIRSAATYLASLLHLHLADEERALAHLHPPEVPSLSTPSPARSGGLQGRSGT